mmetsp:Transcript_19918/g.54942  ORF Transcript_19918/g.54942 Transcript_19918/m.54942 type:complete len:89 (-) Transcript_19918:903-1169(-)
MGIHATNGVPPFQEAARQSLDAGTHSASQRNWLQLEGSSLLIRWLQFDRSSLLIRSSTMDLCRLEACSGLAKGLILFFLTQVILFCYS